MNINKSRTLVGSLNLNIRNIKNSNIIISAVMIFIFILSFFFFCCLQLSTAASRSDESCFMLTSQLGQKKKSAPADLPTLILPVVCSK